MAWHDDDRRPLLAVCVKEDAAPRLRVWDVVSGEVTELPAGNWAGRMAFGVLDGEPVLVTIEDGVALRVWSVAGRRIVATVLLGDHRAHDLHLVPDGARLIAVTQGPRGDVRRWSLPDGADLGRLDDHKRFPIWSGRRADGKVVLLTGGDEGLAQWDPRDGTRLPLRTPAALDPDRLRQPHLPRVRTVALAVVDGRDRVTVTYGFDTIATFDPATGELLGPVVEAHHRVAESPMLIWGHSSGVLAAVGGVVAVATAWRVHLWPGGVPIAGPVGHAELRAVRWAGREVLLTASAYDGVVALWDLDRPVERGPGHEQRISALALIDRGDVVVSVDEGGTILARSGDRMLTPPRATGVNFTGVLAAWTDAGQIRAVTGAGTAHRVSDGKLRRWNVTTGEQDGPAVQAHVKLVYGVLPFGDALVTFGPGQMLKLWRRSDGVLVGQVRTEVRSKVTGFVTGVIGGRAYAALSSYTQPLTLIDLDDLVAPPIELPPAGDDVVVHALAGERVIVSTGRLLRAWTLAGELFGPVVPGPADLTGVVERSWPQMYVARADRTVTLLDLETGRPVAPPITLPRRPGPMAVTGDGDLVVGFGSDVARVTPPA
ncbi:WD40 repeat domain-containing protein [Actinoplanes sp. NPDC049265]|uniref:WD40 repeat domain-containing protein n=1 Tax=Actinoplanes sp. NPDC049265 TaxID=3363902 RepID=UPI003721429E